MAEMTCAKMKRKFEEVEQAVLSCMETLTGYEKCLLQNKLLLARSRMVKYENLCVIYEAQVSMAKLDVEIATSDIDLLLQELQRGKRFKTGEENSTMSASTQTGSQPISSPTKSVSDTSRISFDLPSIDLTSFTRQRSEGQEPSTSQGENAQLSAKSHEENAQELITSQGGPTSQGDNVQELTISQGSKDSGYNSSQRSLLISQETTIRYDSSPKSLVTQEIQVDLLSNNTKEGDIKIVKCTKKFKSKKRSDTIEKTDTSKKVKSTKDKLPSDKIKTKDKPTKANEEVIDVKTQKIDNTPRKSVQRRQSQDNRHWKRDERKSGSYDRRNSTESRNKTTDRFDLVKDMLKHREKTHDRKSPKEKCDTKPDEKQSPNRNDDGIKPKNRPSPKSQNILPTDTKNTKVGDNDKSDKIHRDYTHKEQKKSDQAQNKSEPVQKSTSRRKKTTDPRIKPLRAKNESNKAKYKSTQSEDISCDTTLVIAEESMQIETNLSNQIIEDFTPYEIPHNSPIRYKDFANTILSSVDVTDTSYTTVGVTNSQNSIAQSTPFVRRISTVEHSGSESQDLPPNGACNDPLIEDQLTTFIRTTLADYNRDVAELNLSPESQTITDKTTKLNEENTRKNNANDEKTKINDKNTKNNVENDHKTDKKTKTTEKMIKRTTKQNLIVKIPVTRVPDTINHINPMLVKIPVTTKAKQPCLTVTVNDAGVITIRPRSAENSNLPSPTPDKTVMESHRQNTQEETYLNEPTVKAKAKDVPSTPKTPMKITAQNIKHAEMPTESATYMTEVKDQYYFDVDSPRLADEAPTHKNAVSLFRAFSLLMPPSPTFTMSSSSDKENCTNPPSPPTVYKLPINKKLLDDSLCSAFHSHINYTANDSNDIHISRKKDYRNDICTSHRNDIHTNHRNDINKKYKNDIYTSHTNDIHANHRNDIYKNDMYTSHTNDIHANHRNDIYTSHTNDIHANHRNDIYTSHRNDIHTNNSNNKIINDISNTKKPLPVRRSKSISVTIPRRTTKFTDAQPLPIRRTKSTATPKPRTNRRKSLDDRAILRVLNEPCSSISSKSASPRSSAPTPKKKDGIENILLFNMSD